MKIRSVHDYDAKGAARELLAAGFTVVDDIGEQLYDCARDELLDALGHAGDWIDLRTDRIDTSWGPVFVFRDRGRVTLKEAKAFVFQHRPRP